MRKESKRLRFKILNRDSFTCQYCGAKAPNVELEIDHIVPIAKGGEDIESNLITACFDCNRGKKVDLVDNEAMTNQRSNDSYKQALIKSKVDKLVAKFIESVDNSVWYFMYNKPFDESVHDFIIRNINMDMDDLRIMFFDLLQEYPFETLKKATLFYFEYSQSDVFNAKMVNKDIKRSIIGFIKAGCNTTEAEIRFLSGCASYSLRYTRATFFKNVAKLKENIGEDGEIDMSIFKGVIDYSTSKKELDAWFSQYTTEQHAYISALESLTKWREFMSDDRFQHLRDDEAENRWRREI